jgi:carbamate kinase
MILTNDEYVCIHYDSEQPLALEHMTTAEALTHIANHEFGANKMLPKIEASVNFVSQKPGRKAIITSIDKAKDACHGKTGTVIS